MKVAFTAKEYAMQTEFGACSFPKDSGSSQ